MAKEVFYFLEWHCGFIAQMLIVVVIVVWLLSCVRLFETPGLQHVSLPCLHCLPQFAQTHVCLISDAIQPSHLLASLFSSCLQCFPASESFPMSQLFKWGGQSIGVSASASVLPMNIQCWFPLGWIGLISLQPKGFSRVFSSTGH